MGVQLGGAALTSLDKLQEQLDSLALQLATVNQNVLTVAEGQGKLLAAVHEQTERSNQFTATLFEAVEVKLEGITEGIALELEEFRNWLVQREAPASRKGRRKR